MFCSDGKLDSPDIEQRQEGDEYTITKVLDASRKIVAGVEFNIALKLKASRCSTASYVQAQVSMDPQGNYELTNSRYMPSSMFECSLGRGVLHKQHDHTSSDAVYVYCSIAVDGLRN